MNSSLKLLDVLNTLLFVLLLCCGPLLAQELLWSWWYYKGNKLLGRYNHKALLTKRKNEHKGLEFNNSTNNHWVILLIQDQWYSIALGQQGIKLWSCWFGSCYVSVLFLLWKKKNHWNNLVNSGTWIHEHRQAPRSFDQENCFCFMKHLWPCWKKKCFINSRTQRV